MADFSTENRGAVVAPEDRVLSRRALRGAGARSPLFWKLMLAAMALTWGYSFTVMKDLIEVIPTFMLLSIRFLCAAGLMFVVFRARIVKHFNRRHLAIGAVMGVLMGLGYATQTLGLADTTAGKNAFLTGTYCVLVPFISYFMAGEPLTRYNLGGAALCLAGIAFVALDNLTVQMGDILTLISAVFFALELALVSKYGEDMDVGVLTFWMFLVVGIGCLIAYMTCETAPALSVWTPECIAAMVFLVVVCTFLGLMLQNLGLAHVPAATGSLLLSLESPSGVLFSVLLAGEVLTARLLFGFALIFVAIVLSETHFSFLYRRSA